MSSSDIQSRYSILLNGHAVPIVMRKYARSRRITLRVAANIPQVSITLPRHASLKQALAFADSKRLWLEKELNRQGEKIHFADGTILPLWGEHITISHVGGRGVLRLEEGELRVTGDIDFLSRRVRDFIKAETRDRLQLLANAHAKSLGVKSPKVTVRDTRSRWGSCSHKGDLSFSWRLAFAPSEVFDYLVCHEVAHIREHNHSDRFWAVVTELFPGWRKPERWLSAHGVELYRYG